MKFAGKNVTYDNIKSHTKNSVSLSLWKIHFWKNHKDRVKLTTPKSFRIKNRKFPVLQHTFSEELLFHIYASFPQLHFLIISY